MRCVALQTLHVDVPLLKCVRCPAGSSQREPLEVLLPAHLIGRPDPSEAALVHAAGRNEHRLVGIQRLRDLHDDHRVRPLPIRTDSAEMEGRMTLENWEAQAVEISL